MANIRKSKIKDLNDLSELRYKVMKEHYRYDKYYHLKSKKKSKSKFKKYIKKKIYSKNAIVFLAEEDSKVVGMCICDYSKRPPVFKRKVVGEIGGLYILPIYRGKKFGSRLVARCKEWLKKKKVKTVTLNVHAKNKKAIQLYKKAGFKDFCKLMKLELD